MTVRIRPRIPTIFTDMDFTVFNAENSPHRKVQPGRHEPNITVCHNGGIILNSHLLKLLKNPERVITLEEKRYPGDFYVMASDDPKAFALETPDKRGARRFFSSSLVDHISEAVGAKAPFIVATVEEGKKTDLGTIFALAVKKVRPLNCKPRKDNQ